VQVNPVFNISVTPNTTLCAVAGIPITATPSSGSNITYAWSPNNGTLSNANVQTPTVTPTSTTTYSVTATTDIGCTAIGQVTITDINRTLTVPAGTFKNCVVTTEEGTTPPRRATSVYCPAVGLTSLVVEAFGGEGARLENVLTQHGPRYQL
jgi:hypothetical protein